MSAGTIPLGERILAALREARGALTPARLAMLTGASLMEVLDIAPALPGVMIEGAGLRLARQP